MKVHHIGYAVKNLDKAIYKFTKLGFTVGEIVNDKNRKVKIVFLQNGSESVELVAPDGEENAVDGLLKKLGPTPYHICYEVENLEETIQELTKDRWILTRKAEAAPAINDLLVAFLYQKDVGMIELVEIKTKESCDINEKNYDSWS